jgi:hypothetical protein
MKSVACWAGHLNLVLSGLAGGLFFASGHPYLGSMWIVIGLMHTVVQVMLHDSDWR